MKKVKATCAIIKNENGGLLLIKRGREPFAGHWALISGIGESLKGLPPDVAVQGEVDCDLQTELLSPVLLFEHEVANDEKVDGVIVFEGKVDESKIKLQPPYSLEYAWFSPEEIKSMDKLAFENNGIIERYLNTTS